MKTNSKIILIAEDDEQDFLMTKKAFKKAGIEIGLQKVDDGEEALEYLFDCKQSEETALPALIILDLNMPKIDGREVLRKIKSSERLKSIPSIILTTSSSKEDIIRSYHLGANSYIIKPTDFDGLINIAKSIKDYWLDLVELPS